jgi:hypothetical protein
MVRLADCSRETQTSCCGNLWDGSDCLASLDSGYSENAKDKGAAAVGKAAPRELLHIICTRGAAMHLMRQVLAARGCNKMRIKICCCCCCWCWCCGGCRDVLGVHPTTTTRAGTYADSVIKGYVEQLNAAVNGYAPTYQRLDTSQASMGGKGA